MNDEELREHFEALRQADQRAAPRFGAFTSRGPAPRVSGWTLALGAGLGTASVMVAIALLAPRIGPAPESRAIAPIVLADAEPLAFLLGPIPSLEETP